MLNNSTLHAFHGGTTEVLGTSKTDNVSNRPTQRVMAAGIPETSMSKILLSDENVFFLAHINIM